MSFDRTSTETDSIPEPSAETVTAGRDASGHFAPGNTAALKHGLRSERAALALLPGQEAARAALADLRREWLDDLGGVELSSSGRDLVTRGLRVRMAMDTLEERMDREGVLTTTGRTRASVTLYLQLLDRLMKIY